MLLTFDSTVVCKWACNMFWSSTSVLNFEINNSFVEECVIVGEIEELYFMFKNVI